MSRKSRNIKLLLVSVSFLLLLAYVVGAGLKKTFVYYYTVDELKANAGKVDGKYVKVSGEVVAGSVNRAGNHLSFILTENGDSVHVEYTGPVPDAFSEGISVVVEGVYHKANNSLKAKNLLTKCPSKYEPEIDSTKA